MNVTASLGFVRTSTIEVVKRFEANGLYSPAVVGMLLVDETTSKDDATAGAMASDDVKETIGPIDIGIRWPGCDGIIGITDG